MKKGKINGAVLDNSRFPDPNNVNEQILVNRIKTWDGQTKTVVDSVIGTLWAPNGRWFLAIQRLGREGQWERALFNRVGKKILLPSAQSSISGSVWSADGSALAIPHSGNASTVIEHSNITENPITWNQQHGLVTRTANRVVSYIIQP